MLQMFGEEVDPTIDPREAEKDHRDDDLTMRVLVWAVFGQMVVKKLLYAQIPDHGSDQSQMVDVLGEDFQ